MKARRFGTFALWATVVTATSGALLAQAPQAIGTWVSVGEVSPALTNGAAVALPDKRTLIAGGTANGMPIADVTIYDPVDNSVTAAGTLASARTDHTATLLEDGRVLVVGGITADGLVSSDIEVFDPATGSSAIVAFLPEPRSGHVAAGLPDGSVLITGGASVDGVLPQTAILFDSETASVSAVAGQLQFARVHASATTLLDGRVFVVGGSNGTVDLASAEIYDRYMQSFSIAATSMRVGRHGHTAVLLPDNGGVLVAGGTSNGLAQASVDLFLPAVFPDPFSYGEGEFVATGAMTTARARAVAGPTSVEGYAFAAAGGSLDTEVYRFATIKTDKDDYAPGELAVITGSGWQPNEEVTLLFQEDPAVHDDYVVKVRANSNGNISWNTWAPEQPDFGVRFYLTATGSKSMAQTTFTDGNKVTFSMASNGAEIASFGTVSVNQCVNAYVQERQGNNLDGGSHGARTVTLSSDPAGVAFFAGSGCGTSGSVVTILANTPAAAFSFKISNSSVNQYTINGAAGLTGNNNPSATVTLLTAKANQTISVTAAAPAAAAFGSTFEVAATATSLLPVTITTSGSCSGGDVDGTATITMTAGTGICTVAYNQAGNAAYNAAPPLTNHTAAAKADAVCTVTGYSGTYNAAAHGASGSCAGVADDPTATGSTLDLGTSFTDVPGGTAHWSFTGGTNYNDQAGTVDIEITKADAICTIHGYSAPYDATAHGASGGCTGVDTGGVALGGTLDLGASFTNVPGGTAHWSFTGGTNYNDQAGTVDIEITKADAVCTIHGYSAPYDATAHGASGGCTGVDTGGVALGGTLDLGASFTNVPGGTAHWSFTGGTNYNDQAGTVDIEITKADAVCTIHGYSAPYDATAHGASGGCTGVDTGGVALGGTLDLGASFTNVPGGTAHWSFTGGTNYLDEEGDISIVITKADAVCSIHGYDVVFDDAYHTATGTCTGVDGALLAGLDLSGTTHKAADAYVDTWTFVDVTGNYNDRSGTVDDQIRHWTTNGFYQPVDMGASPIVWNTIKGGQTVPLKFNLWAGSQKKTSVSDVRNFVAFPMSCNASSFDSTIELTTTGGTTLRYDGSGGQFIQNWQTPKISGQCYMVRLTALDGSVIEAYFKTK